MRARGFIQRFWRSELGGLAGDTSYVGVWQGASAIAELVQIALITHALGLASYGQLAIVIAYVSLVGGFFNVRVGIAATTEGAGPLARRDYRTAARVFRFAYLIDFGTIGCALLVVAVTAPFVGPNLVGEGGTALIVLYSLVLVAQALDNTSITVLRLLDRFQRVAVNFAVMEPCRVALVILALSIDDSLVLVAAAIATARVACGAVNAVSATKAFKQAGQGWRLTDRVGPMERDSRRRMLATIFHTNLVGYARIGQQQVPTLLLGAIAGPTETGVYKAGMALAAGITKLTDPASAALLPRFSRLWAEDRKEALRRLVRQTTVITIPVVTAAMVFLVVFREPLLHLLAGGSEGSQAGTVLILGAIGGAFHAAVFWRVNLLYAVGQASTVSKVLLIVTALDIAAVALLVPSMGAEGAALVFMLDRIVTAFVLSNAAVRALSAEDGPHMPALAGSGGS
jgi:O-antigen/teichoic acid export membrane protein